MYIGEHKDNPNEVLEYLDTLEPYERGIFQKGYITALYRLLEQLSDSKAKIASKMMEEDISTSVKMMLDSRLHILDIYESHYVELINDLEGRRELQP